MSNIRLIPSYRIEIGDYLFNHAHRVEIQQDRRTLTDTCTLQMPLKYKQEQLNKAIKIGDKVKVYLAYDKQFRELPHFEGYVSAKQPGYPFTINCQDAMWLLKKAKVKGKTFVKADIKTIVQYLAPNAAVETPKMQIEQYIVDGSTPVSKHLEKLHTTFGFDVYFRHAKLYVGLPLQDRATQGKRVAYDLQKTVVNNSLKYVTKENTRARIKAITTLADGSKKEYTAGDGNGRANTMQIPGISLEALKILATERLKEQRYNGLQGNITAYGLPYVEQGWIADIEDEWWGLKGAYFINAVTTTSGLDGFRNIVEIGRSAQL